MQPDQAQFGGTFDQRNLWINLQVGISIRRRDDEIIYACKWVLIMSIDIIIYAADHR